MSSNIFETTRCASLQAKHLVATRAQLCIPCNLLNLLHHRHRASSKRGTLVYFFEEAKWREKCSSTFARCYHRKIVPHKPLSMIVGIEKRSECSFFHLWKKKKTILKICRGTGPHRHDTPASTFSFLRSSMHGMQGGIRESRTFCGPRKYLFLLFFSHVLS